LDRLGDLVHLLAVRETPLDQHCPRDPEIVGKQFVIELVNGHPDRAIDYLLRLLPTSARHVAAEAGHTQAAAIAAFAARASHAAHAAHTRRHAAAAFAAGLLLVFTILLLLFGHLDRDFLALFFHYRGVRGLNVVPPKPDFNRRRRQFRNDLGFRVAAIVLIRE